MLFRTIRSLPLLLVTAVCLTHSIQIAFGADPVTAPATESAEADANLAASQEAIAMRYRRFEGALQQLSEYLRKTDPARAELLVRAIGKSKEGRVADQFQSLTDLLKKDQLGDAIEQQETLVAEMKTLLELLMSEARRDEIELEKKRIQNLIKEVTKLIGQETDARAETERGGKNTELTEKQQKIANSTKGLVESVEKHDASRKAGKNEPKSSDQKDSKSKEDPANPKDQNSDDKGDPETPSDDQKPSQSDGNSDAQKKSDGNQNKKNSESKDGKPKDFKQKDDQGKSKNPQDEQKPPSDKDSKDEKGADSKDADPAEKKSDSGSKDQQDQKSPDGKKPSSNQKQHGKPKDGKQKDGKPQKGQPQEGEEQQQSPDQKSEDQDQQDSDSQDEQDKKNSTERTPGREEIKRAMREMNRAIEELKKKNNKGASDKQDRAIAQLLKAKEKLEEILLQKREEERELVLAQLETRFRDMLVKQEVIFNSTVAIGAVTADDRTDRHRTQSVNLARDEFDIAMLADKALMLLKEEGSSIAFPEAVEQIRDDMQTIAKRLERVDVGEITQSIERDTIESLKEVIEAMQREIEKLKDKKQQSQSPGEQKQQQQQQQQGQQKIAEMKMLRSLQFRVNRRTKQLGRLVDGEQALDADVLNQLRQLSDRQAKVQKATYDLATGKNQ